ncbi:MAG: hypothetical protein KDD00_03625 [Ignavibacteriae bacterium]|nr:hypothetical protein [Ignavibacteriota bacterium]
MKRIIIVIAVIFFSSNFSNAQFKGYDDKGPSTNTSGSNNLILGFINPNKFTMNHSFSVSMLNSSYGNVSLTSYINSMNYQVNDRFNISADVKVQYSPFANNGLGAASSQALQRNLSGVFLSRAAVNYRISENSFINFEYRNIDQSDYLYNNYNPFNPYSSYNSNWR